MAYPVKSYSVSVPDLAGQEFALSSAQALANKFKTSMTAEAAARVAGDAALTQALTALTSRVEVVEQRPDLVTDAEKQAIEKAIADFVRNNDWSWFSADLSIIVEGNAVSLRSAVLSILLAREMVERYWDAWQGYRPTVARYVMSDGSTRVFICSTSTLDAAGLTDVLGTDPANPEVNGGELNEYTCTAFDGAESAVFATVYERQMVSIADDLPAVPRWVRRAERDIVVRLQGFEAPTAGTTPSGVDVDGNGTSDGTVTSGGGTTPPSGDPVADALAALNLAIAAKQAADAEAQSAADAVVAAQSAANTAANDYFALAASSVQSMADANTALSGAQSELSAAQDSLTQAAQTRQAKMSADAAEQQAVYDAQNALETANAGGVQSEIDAAQQALSDATAARETAAGELNDAMAAYDAAEQLVQAKSAAVDTAGATISSITTALGNANALSQQRASELQAAQALSATKAQAATDAASAVTAAQSVYDSLTQG